MIGNARRIKRCCSSFFRSSSKLDTSAAVSVSALEISKRRGVMDVSVPPGFPDLKGDMSVFGFRGEWRPRGWPGCLREGVAKLFLLSSGDEPVGFESDASSLLPLLESCADPGALSVTGNSILIRAR